VTGKPSQSTVPTASTAASSRSHTSEIEPMFEKLRRHSDAHDACETRNLHLWIKVGLGITTPGGSPYLVHVPGFAVGGDAVAGA
jgi:hypothetical protein